MKFYSRETRKNTTICVFCLSFLSIIFCLSFLTKRLLHHRPQNSGKKSTKKCKKAKKKHAKKKLQKKVGTILDFL